MGEVEQPQGGGNRAGRPRRRELTARELEVLRYYAHGLERRMVATAMGISPETVKSYCESAKAKLAAKNMAHAVALAFRLGLID